MDFHIWLKSPMLLEALTILLTLVGSQIGWDEKMEFEVIPVVERCPAVFTLTLFLLSVNPPVTQQARLIGKHIAADCTLKVFCLCGYNGFSGLRNAKTSCFIQKVSLLCMVPSGS